MAVLEVNNLNVQFDTQDGAVFAVGLGPDQDAAKVRDRMLGDGVICRPIGPDTLAFCPPLMISDAQVDRIVDALASALR